MDLCTFFSQISYYLSNQEVETVYNPGQAITMLGLLKYPEGYVKAQGMNMCWSKDSSTAADIAVANATYNPGFATKQGYLIQQPTIKGKFSFIVPLKHIFGFCEDYDKVVYGLKHTISLYRKGDNDAIYRAAAAAAGKVVISKVSWFMPHVLPSDEEKFALYKTIESKFLLQLCIETDHVIH